MVSAKAAFPCIVDPEEKIGLTPQNHGFTAWDTDQPVFGREYPMIDDRVSL
ncbi:hypothetical protein GW860_07340 [bacterium]|nr:hypothetical protein [bacterium]